MFDNKHLLAALLAVLPWAEQIYSEREASERLWGDKRGSERVHSALEKAYSTLLRWITDDSVSPDQEVWQCAVRHNDPEGAARMCAEVNQLSDQEAKTLVSWYARVIKARDTLLGKVAAD